MRKHEVHRYALKAGQFLMQKSRGPSSQIEMFYFDYDHRGMKVKIEHLQYVILQCTTILQLFYLQTLRNYMYIDKRLVVLI
ncbi:MAG: hypothetical protein Phog2KO_48080 [Phototrophicaceae bacterium]